MNRLAALEMLCAASKSKGPLRAENQLSGTVKTAHGDAIPRSACVPSGISDTPVSAASVPETRTALSSGRHSPSSRLTRLTAGPIADKSTLYAVQLFTTNIHA